MSNKKRELKNEYKQTHAPMGVYQIRNLVNGKIFIEERERGEAERNSGEKDGESMRTN